MKTLHFLLFLIFTIRLFAQPELPFESKQGYFDGLAIVTKNGKFGYVDKGNRIIVPIIYDQAKSFTHGRALVTLDGKSGIIDKSGKVIVAIEYQDVHFLGNEDNPDTTILQAFSDINIKEGCCFFNYDGSRICPQVNNVSCDKMIVLKTMGDIVMFQYKKIHVDKEGDETIENYCGVCSRNGKVMVEPLFREIIFYDHVIYAKARSYNEQSSVFDLSGNEILKVKWMELKNGFFEYTKMDQSKGKISLDGKLI